MFNEKKKAYLMLENGTVYEGYSFGVPGTTFGEAVFNTSMVGYLEAVTNPNFYDKLVVWAFPNAGNYGVNIEDAESENITASALIVRECCEIPSNFRNEITLDEFMMKNNLVGIEGIDTRSLVRLIRDEGAMKAVVTTEDVNADIDGWKKKIADYKLKNSAEDLSTKEVIRVKAADEKYNVAVIDFGFKKSIKDALLENGCSLTIFPSTAKADEIKAVNPDGIVLSNGTANPVECSAQVELVKEICKMNVPVMAIDLGHEILALANGGTVEKLKYGHRGSNHPVINTKTGTTTITEQAQSYVVKDVPANAEKIYENNNDKTCAGIEYKDIPAFSVQFSPRQKIYDKFINMMNK